MNDRDDDANLAPLTRWCARLATALDLHGVEVDIDAVLALAGTAAHAVMRPAAPLTTYLVGYAAGLAAATDLAGSDPAGSGRPEALPAPAGQSFTSAASIAAALAESGDH